MARQSSIARNGSGEVPLGPTHRRGAQDRRQRSGQAEQLASGRRYILETLAIAALLAGLSLVAAFHEPGLAAALGIGAAFELGLAGLAMQRRHVPGGSLTPAVANLTLPASGRPGLITPRGWRGVVSSLRRVTRRPG